MTPTLQLVQELVEEWRQSPEVLIVDDDQVYAHTFGALLTRCGCNVTICHDGQEAILAVDEHKSWKKPYDIIFLDLRIPVATGPEVLHHIKEMMPDVPVVIVTGYAESEMVQECLKYGYLGLVQKPLDLKEIEIIFNRHRIALPEHQTKGTQ